MAESLKNKTVKGIAWSGIDNVLQMGVSFVVSIVLARLLSPEVMINAKDSKIPLWGLIEEK